MANPNNNKSFSSILQMQKTKSKDASNFTSEAELVYYYYQFIYFGRAHIIGDKISSSAQLEWSHGLRILLKIGFAFSRFIAYGKFLYFILQLKGFFNGIHGELEVFDVIEIYLWMLPTFFYVGDFMMLSSKFLKNLDSSFILFNNVWRRVKDCLGTYESVRQSLRDMILQFAKHSGSIDYCQYVNVIYAFAGTMGHKTSVYSTLPESWKSEWLEWVFTFLEVMNINWLLVAVSLMTTFPGVLSVVIEKLLCGLSDSLAKGNLVNYSAEQIILDYRKLELSTRELNKRLGLTVLLYQFAQGAQQVAQTYCVFQLIRVGVEFGDIQMLLLDLLQTSSRLFHSFHAMSRVAESSDEFLNSLKRRITLTKKNVKQLKAQTRSLQRICMRVGPCHCQSDFPLAAISVYMNYYVSAALWPSPT